MVPYWSSLTTPKHNIHLFPFISLSAGRTFMLEFLCWSSKAIWFGAFQIAPVILVICCSDFFSRCDLFLWSEGRSWMKDRGSWFRFAGCWFGIMQDFFKQPPASVQIRPFDLLNFLSSFDWFGRFCLLLCHCIILTWNPIDYLLYPLLLVVHQRNYCFGISSLWL